MIFHNITVVTDYYPKCLNSISCCSKPVRCRVNTIRHTIAEMLLLLAIIDTKLLFRSWHRPNHIHEISSDKFWCLRHSFETFFRLMNQCQQTQTQNDWQAESLPSFGSTNTCVGRFVCAAYRIWCCHRDCCEFSEHLFQICQVAGKCVHNICKKTSTVALTCSPIVQSVERLCMCPVDRWMGGCQG